MEFLKFLMYLAGMYAAFKPLDILIKKAKVETNTTKKILMHVTQLCLGVIGCYFFYKMGMWASDRVGY